MPQYAPVIKNLSISKCAAPLALRLGYPQNGHGPLNETVGQQVKLLEKAYNASATADSPAQKNIITRRWKAQG